MRTSPYHQVHTGRFVLCSSETCPFFFLTLFGFLSKLFLAKSFFLFTVLLNDLFFFPIYDRCIRAGPQEASSTNPFSLMHTHLSRGIGLFFSLLCEMPRNIVTVFLRRSMGFSSPPSLPFSPFPATSFFTAFSFQTPHQNSFLKKFPLPFLSPRALFPFTPSNAALSRSSHWAPETRRIFLTGTSNSE